MKKIIALVLAACLLTMVFTGCGGTKSKTYDVNKIVASISEAAPIENTREYAEDDLVYDIGVDMEAVAEFGGVIANTLGKSGAILVIKAADGKLDTVKTQMETYKQSLTQTNYAEFAAAAEQAKNGRLVVSGDYIVFVIAAEGVDYATVDTAIENALK